MSMPRSFLSTAAALVSFALFAAGCNSGTLPDAPTALVYSTSTATYTKGTAIAANLPTSTGGAVESYAVLPALPAGLVLNTTTGIISGTPTAVAAAATYVVTATNGGGSTTASLSITVIDVAPSTLAYSANPAVYLTLAAITPNTPTSSGGAVVSYAVAPALPAGLALSTTTGIVSGTPTAVTPLATYVVTATNSGGSTTANLVLTVNVALPSIAYGSPTYAFTKNAAITTLTPSNTGGEAASWAISATLPAGLAFSTATGVISGTPTAITAAASYTVTATNATGSASATLSIAVNDVAPSSLVYSTNPAVYTKGSAITANSPTAAGGTVISYAVAPALPAGLALNTTTGVITGTPTALAAVAVHVVTATNSGGSTSANLTLTVRDVPPSSLVYTTSTAIYTKGVAIASNTPTAAGGPVVSYAVAPALPAGLVLNTTTGVISGASTVIAPTGTYVVTATNSGGSTPATLSITVNDVPPSALVYSLNPAIYTNGVAITPNPPRNSGGAVVSYAVAPALPAGLVLSTTTGIITGTPTAITPLAGYVVTAGNSGGSTTANVTITVKIAAPSGLAYTVNPAIYTLGTAITANSPSSGGGAVASYAVLPALPTGLVLNTTTGVVSGTPTAITPLATYVVTATNDGGSATANLAVTVNDVAPTELTYGTNPAIYTKDAVIAPNLPTHVGSGTVVSYAVVPALPAGLVLNTTTGIISGTPTVVAALATYVVTATNSGGSTTANLVITVNDIPPSALTYTVMSATYTTGAAIAANTPTSSGGAVVRYAVLPALPAGLALDTTTGIISGTPTVVATVLTYVVTAYNSGGSTQASLSITVNLGPPSGLTYSMNPASYPIGTVITANTPTVSGPVDSYGVSSALPTGLSLSPSTGIITGTPTVLATAATYTVTATNTAGSTTAALSIAVVPATFDVSGTVTGTVAAGVTLTLSGAASSSTITDGSGNYTFSALSNGAYTITPSLAGYTFTPTSLAVTVSGANVTGRNFVAASQAIYAISGTVSGTVASGVTVALTGTATATTTTGAGGTYSFTGLTNGSYTVTPSFLHTAFTPVNRAVTVAGASVTGRDFTSSVASTYTISGTVTGAWGEDVLVTLGGASSATTRTSDVGAYSFTGLYDGSYTVTPSLDGYTYSPSAPTVVVAGGNMTQNFTASTVIASYSISGTVTYGGSRTGVTYVGAVGNGCVDCNPQASTALAGTGTFTIHGLIPGTYQLVAWMDFLGDGVRNGSDPNVTTGTVTILSTNLTGVVVNLVDPTPPAPQTPSGLSVFPGDNGAAVFWNAPSSGGIETQTGYRIYWGTDAAATNRTPIEVPALNNAVYMLAASNGDVLYFKISGFVGASESAVSGVVGPKTIGPTAGANVLSGTVTFPVTATGPMIVGAFDQGAGVMRSARIATPVSPQAFTISGIPSGSSYMVFAILDQNNSGLIEAGNLDNTNGAGSIAITGPTTRNVVLAGGGAEVRVATEHQVTQSVPGSDSYGIRTRALGHLKLPVLVTLYSGHGVLVPAGLGKSFGTGFESSPYWSSTRPTVGDLYRFKVWYSDATSELKTGTLAVVLDAFANSLSVVATPSKNIPTFHWLAPASPPASYTYRLWLSGSGANWYYPSRSDMPSTQLSVQYNTDGNASPSSLVNGSTYGWAITVQDQDSNLATVQASYTVPP
jgi:hypothetical protein